MDTFHYHRPEDLEADLRKMQQQLTDCAQAMAAIAVPLGGALLKRTVHATVGADVHRCVLRWVCELSAIQAAVGGALAKLEKT